MTHTPHRQSSFPRAGRSLTACGILLAVCGLGCQSANYYQATALPEQYVARPTENARLLDLSKLAVRGVGNDYIDNGDVLEVSIAAGLTKEDISILSVRVNQNGEAQVPLIGNIPVGGLDLEGAEQAISAACTSQGIYTSPQVTVTMKRQRENRVTVLGAVKEPGVIKIPRGNCDLLSAITLAGGLTEDAGTNVEIRQPGTVNKSPRREPIADRGRNPLTRRVGYAPADGQPLPEPLEGDAQYDDAPSFSGERNVEFSQASSSGPNSIHVDLVKAVKDGKGGGFLQDGAVVMVEKEHPLPITVTGLVRKPMQIDYPVGQNLYVMQAISMAEGTSSKVANKVIITRQVPESTEPIVIEVSMREAKRKKGANVLLAPGDMISVETTPSTVLLDAVEIIRFGVGATVF